MQTAEVKKQVKELIAKYGEPAKKHFSADKSYTNKSTDELSKLFKSKVAVPVSMTGESGAKASTAPACKVPKLIVVVPV